MIKHQYALSSANFHQTFEQDLKASIIQKIARPLLKHISNSFLKSFILFLIS